MASLTIEPAACAPKKKVLIVVSDEQENLLGFRMKTTTKIEKMFVAFSKKKGLPREMLSFFFGETYLSGGETPKSLNLIDNAKIHCIRASELDSESRQLVQV